MLVPETLQRDIAQFVSRDDAYARMLDAALARDDAAYEQARRDFWGSDVPAEDGRIAA